MECKRDGRENREWFELGALNVLGDDGGETRGFIQTGVANLERRLDRALAAVLVGHLPHLVDDQVHVVVGHREAERTKSGPLHPAQQNS